MSTSNREEHPAVLACDLRSETGKARAREMFVALLGKQNGETTFAKVSMLATDRGPFAVFCLKEPAWKPAFLIATSEGELLQRIGAVEAKGDGASVVVEAEPAVKTRVKWRLEILARARRGR